MASPQSLQLKLTTGDLFSKALDNQKLRLSGYNPFLDGKKAIKSGFRQELPKLQSPHN